MLVGTLTHVIVVVNVLTAVMTIVKLSGNCAVVMCGQTLANPWARRID